MAAGDPPNFGSELTGGGGPPSGGGLGGGVRDLFGGGRKRSMGDVRAQFKVDDSSVKALATAFKDLTANVNQFTTSTDKATASLKKFNAESKRMSRSGPGAPGAPGGDGDGSASASYGNGTNSKFSAGNAMKAYRAFRGMGGAGAEAAGAEGAAAGMAGAEGGAAMAGGAAGGPIGVAVVAVAKLVGDAVGAAIARVEKNIDYSLAANQKSVQLQMTGFGNGPTGNGRSGINTIRDSLKGFALGGPDEQGYNRALTLARGYGAYDAASLQKSTLAAGRSMDTANALSGYSMTAQEQAGVVQSAQAPQNVNKLQAFYGINIYGSSGTLEGDPIVKIAQGLMKKWPNFSKKDWSRGLVPGAGVRSMMLNTGVPEDMLESVIQYILSQQQFKQAGGTGWVDLQSNADLKTLGIEEEHATAAAQTQAAKSAREENFYQRQTDNYADLETATKHLTEAMGSLEDKFSGLYGAGIGVSPYLSAITNVAKKGFPVLGALFGGDPTGEIDTGLSVQSGYGDTRLPIGELDNNSSFAKLDTRMKTRLKQMFTAAGGKLGIGGGWRDSATQEAMFRDRYRPDPSGEIEWQGQHWKRVKGAPAAPPGRSFHEIGLAADLVGDMGWLQANAGRFGLKTFANVNNEEWHVQLSELPNSRSQWEKDGGAVVSTEPTTNADGTSMPLDEESGGIAGSMARMLGLFGSIGDTTIGGTSLIGAADIFGTSSTSGGSAAGAAAAAAGGINYSGTGPMSGEDVARLAYNAGFRGENLVNMVAIADRESSFDPGSYNPTASTKDLSFGLWQINMLGDMGPARRKLFGISKNEDLYDPATNARAAFILSSGGTNLRDWGAYKGKSNTYNTDIASAQAYVHSAGLGDPTGEGMGGGNGGSVTIRGGTALSYSPVFNINITGSGNTEQDGRRLGEAAFQYSRDRLEEMMLRAS